jgi:hypothetical protein
MPKEAHKIQLPLIVAAFLVTIAGVVTLLLIRHVADPDYWLSGAAALIPLVFAVAGKALRVVNPPSQNELDEQAAELRALVLAEWRVEVEQRISIYPLPVPFSGALKVTAPVMATVDHAKPAVELEVTVMDTWQAILRDPHRPPPSIDGDFNSIADLFGAEGMPCRLVVLGEPGSGKSILAQWLTVKLIEAETASGRAISAGAGPLAMVPVLLPLASWDPGMPLKKWAAVRMARSYPWLSEEIQSRNGTSRTLAAMLIDQDRVLMVLDGLDEIAAENRLQAFKRLSEAARKDQSMVVTCRTREYAQLVHDRRQPMPRTPVIRLNPMPQAEVHTYLTAAQDRCGSQLSELLAEVKARPDGPLAGALSTPFALWLVSEVYQNPDNDPAALAHCQTPDKVLQHLLDGLITAVYSVDTDDFPAREEPAIASARSRLTRIAEYLGPNLDRQNIDWWRMPEQVPRLFVGGLIGGLVGCVLGTAVGLAAATRFSEPMGIRLGVVFGIVTGVLSGVTSVRSQEHPRTVDLHWKWDYWKFVGCLTVGVAVGLVSGYADARHGGLIAGLITAGVVGPACAIPCGFAFGWAPGITAGLTASIALGLSSGLSQGNGHPVVSGLACGVVFAGSAWLFVGLFQPAQDKLVANPRVLLQRDRVGCQVVALTAGVAFAVVYGVALGPVFGAVAFVALTISVAVTVSMWGAFNVSRFWLAGTGMLPIQVMTFLNEAYCRGVLRQVGGSYQFRHTGLKEALLAPAAEPGFPRGDQDALESTTVGQ